MGHSIQELSFTTSADPFVFPLKGLVQGDEKWGYCVLLLEPEDDEHALTLCRSGYGPDFGTPQEALKNAVALLRELADGLEKLT